MLPENFTLQLGLMTPRDQKSPTSTWTYDATRGNVLRFPGVFRRPVDHPCVSSFVVCNCAQLGAGREGGPQMHATQCAPQPVCTGPVDASYRTTGAVHKTSRVGCGTSGSVTSGPTERRWYRCGDPPLLPVTVRLEPLLSALFIPSHHRRIPPLPHAPQPSTIRPTQASTKTRVLKC